MSHTSNALEKVLTLFLTKKYPEIEKVQIVETRFDDMDITKYKVFVGLKYSALEKYDSDEIKDDVRQMSKYVLNKGQSIEGIYMYNPED